MTIPRKTTCIIFTILAAAAASISITTLSSRYADIEKLSRANSLSIIDERLEGAFAAVNDFPGSAARDILFLKSLARGDDIRQFLYQHEVYRDVYLFDSIGDCVARVNAKAGVESACKAPEIVRVHEGRLEGLATGAVHISPIVLYEDTPALIYATHRALGTIVTVIDANYFLEEIRRLKRGGEAVYLLLTDGSYLAHPDVSKEKLFGGNGNFYRDFTDIPGGALDNPEMRQFETDSHIFTFKRIYPSASNFAIYEGSSALYGKDHVDEDYWIMAAVSELPQRTSWWETPSYVFTVGLIVLLHLSILGLAYATMLRIESHNEEFLS